MLRRLLTAAAAPLAAAYTRVVAVGDLHGDLSAAMNVLTKASLIQCGKAGDARSCNWVGGDALLVQMGDILDRGPEATQLVEFMLDTLPPRVQAGGGSMVVLLGNHELLNLQGYTHYVHEAEASKYGGRAQVRSVFSLPDGPWGQRLSRLPAAHEAAGVFFVHGGLMPDFAHLGASGLSSEVGAAIERMDWDAHILGDLGPLWNRHQLNSAVKGECFLVDEALRRLNAAKMGRSEPARRIVVGHTIQDGSIHEYCDGKMIAIDVALSRWAGDHNSTPLSFLEIDILNGTAHHMRHVRNEPASQPPPPPRHRPRRRRRRR
eukprot:TRINITY_DN1418_c0_g1_i3.p1 TRINITY_DN1418_c0_g1~~TRINITY_DN1418_c0_g1_i3.p1  ORF type:complete len:319 (+),score=31.32 TRINITY_DN1418_c0_g1_i3:100-1056(+)